MRRIGNYAISHCMLTHSLLLDAALDDLHALGVEGNAAGAVDDLVRQLPSLVEQLTPLYLVAWT